MDHDQFQDHKAHVAHLLRDLGEDPDRDGLLKTPERYLKAMTFLTSGYQKDVAETINKAMFQVDYKDMVIVRDIEFYSLCEHHLLPFYGKVHVGYIPSGKVVGLSKIPRIIEIFSRRFQVQERLTDEISTCLYEHLTPDGVGVIVEAYHLCMMMRGVEKQSSYTTTSSMKGSFSQAKTRSEFLSLIHSRSLSF